MNINTHQPKTESCWFSDSACWQAKPDRKSFVLSFWESQACKQQASKKSKHRHSRNWVRTNKATKRHTCFTDIIVAGHPRWSKTSGELRILKSCGNIAAAVCLPWSAPEFELQILTWHHCWNYQRSHGFSMLFLSSLIHPMQHDALHSSILIAASLRKISKIRPSKAAHWRMQTRSERATCGLSRWDVPFRNAGESSPICLARPTAGHQTVEQRGASYKSSRQTTTNPSDETWHQWQVQHPEPGPGKQHRPVGQVEPVNIIQHHSTNVPRISVLSFDDTWCHPPWNQRHPQKPSEISNQDVGIFGDLPWIKMAL